MCKSIYKKLREDFNFVTEYGFSYVSNFEHYEYPSIKFINPNKDTYLSIGMDYHKWQFTVRYWSIQNWRDWRDFHELDLELEGAKKSYKSQLPLVQQQLKEFLEKSF